MSSPYVGEIRMFGGNYAPLGWALCQGQLMSISENETLFNLIGTTYGGDGQNTFALPDLRSRVPIHMGAGPGLSPNVIGERAGVETVILTAQQMPTHSHTPMANTVGSATAPTNGVWANSPAIQFQPAPTGGVTMNVGALGVSGGNQPHENMVPYLALNFIISLFGIYPTPT